MEPPAGSPLQDPAGAEQERRWKRKRRSLWKRLFQQSVLVVLGAIAVAVVLLYFLIHNIGTYKAPD
jgi:hypothetical protein